MLYPRRMPAHGSGGLLGPCLFQCVSVLSGPAPVPACGRPGGSRRVRPPLRLAYADPPYPGKAWLYRDHPDYGGEVNHVALIERLADYDGWALSTSAEALPAVLALCPAGARLAAWHRGERPTPSRWPLHAWEPVIYYGGRQIAVTGLQTRRVDSVVCGVAPLTTLPGRVIGAKPAAVCRWIFDLLGAGPGDSFDDLFPGSGAVGRAWAAFIGADPPDPGRPDTSHPTAEAARGRQAPRGSGSVSARGGRADGPVGDGAARFPEVGELAAPVAQARYSTGGPASERPGPARGLDHTGGPGPIKARPARRGHGPVASARLRPRPRPDGPARPARWRPIA